MWVLSFAAAFFSLILAVLGAYSFSRVRYRGRSVLQRGVLFVYMFGGILILIPLYQLAVKSGLASTQVGIFVAMIDGCTRFETIVRIIVPPSIPALATVFIYSFMIAWNEYLYASVFLKAYKELYTLPIGLKSLFVSKNAIWDRIMAGSMLTAVPVVVLFMLVQKNLVAGLTAGGVKY